MYTNHLGVLLTHTWSDAAGLGGVRGFAFLTSPQVLDHLTGLRIVL